MAKYIKRPMTNGETVEMVSVVTVLIWFMTACLQGVAYVFFGLLSGWAFMLALVLAPALAWVWHASTSDGMIDDDASDEAGA